MADEFLFIGHEKEKAGNAGFFAFNPTGIHRPNRQIL